MSGGSFLDTNVLAYTDDRHAPEKQQVALDLVERVRRTGTGVVSTQILQEYFVTATRKLGVPRETARRKVEIFLVRAATRSGCSTLFTEDLQHGQRFGELAVVNPFV